MSRARGWCFTLNNYAPEDEEAIKTFASTKAKYLVFGHEVGESGTPHLQGYVSLRDPMTLDALKKSLSEKAHFERAKGNAKQNLEYCTKQDKAPYVHGELPRPGRRTDLESITRDVVAHKPLSQIALEHPVEFVLYGNGITRLAAASRVDRDREKPPYVSWIWGAAGVGKTRHVFDAHPSLYVKDLTKWWDGYEQQEAILIDDYDGTWPFRDFLRLLDRYPYQGQTKGGYVKVNSPFIYITAEFPPEVHYRVGNELDQVSRRLTEVIHLQ